MAWWKEGQTSFQDCNDEDREVFGLSVLLHKTVFPQTGIGRIKAKVALLSNRILKTKTLRSRALLATS